MVPYRKTSIHQRATELRAHKMDVSQVTWGNSSFILFIVLTKLWQILFFGGGACHWTCGISPNYELNLRPLQWKSGVLSTEPSGGVPDPLLSEKLFLVHSCGWNSHIAWSAKNAITLFWWLSAFYLMIFFHTPCGNMSTGTATCWPPNSRAELKTPVDLCIC